MERCWRVSFGGGTDPRERKTPDDVVFLFGRFTARDADDLERFARAMSGGDASSDTALYASVLELNLRLPPPETDSETIAQRLTASKAGTMHVVGDRQVLLVELFEERQSSHDRNEVFLDKGACASPEHTVEVVQAVSRHISLCEAMRTFTECASTRLLRAARERGCVAEDYTFWPFNDARREIPVTIAFMEGEEDAPKEVYTLLGLREKFPALLRRECSLVAKYRRIREGGTRLISPHLARALRPHDLKEARESSILGDVEFYHYGHEGLDDSGWGCAYRSLQMIASWLVLNGMAPGKKAPRIPEIQQVLVEMGVMDVAFVVGCSEWIGSQEISWVLAQLFSIECRFLFCKGSELTGLVGDLMRHFEEVGSPVVVCGANLALTVLGVACDALCTDARFLIADPHFRGPDLFPDVVSKTVPLAAGLRGSGVGWRTLKGAFRLTEQYTLLLPYFP